MRSNLLGQSLEVSHALLEGILLLLGGDTLLDVLDDPVDHVFLLVGSQNVGGLQLVVQATVQYASRTARYPTKIDARCAPFVRIVPLLRKVHVVALDKLVAGAPLRRHEALVVDEELADPGADRDHVEKDQDEGDPLRPGV